jgi:hypothetical protein
MWSQSSGETRPKSLRQTGDTMSEEAENSAPEIVTVDNEVVGAVGETLWHDASGFDIVAVYRAGADVVVPVTHEHMNISERVPVNFSADEVREAPTVGELMARGGESAVRLVAEHYNVGLAGPPPGPSTTKLPPWWTKTRGEGDIKGKER